MALSIITNCCTTSFIQTEVCSCFAGFEIAGLTPSTVYSVVLRTPKQVHERTFTSSVAGVLQIDIADYPTRVVNRFGGIYELEVRGVTFGADEKAGYQFEAIDCNDTGYKTLNDTPNE